jgi:hypothetical protein
VNRVRVPSVATLLGAALGVAACAERAPPLGRGLSGNIMAASAAFDQRVKTRFPVGSQESALTAELAREGFVMKSDPDPSQRYWQGAVREIHRFPCLESWSVNWNADGGKITDVRGGFGTVCP